ncbi:MULTISPECIES: TIGR04219 family outer membrane beta-barrel protein [Acinetobacter]|uniref:TIGR04219 family outer membrane beta-barrel protein n=1 Tax=Acinetobacter TaxID=469 RepID=UPI0022E90549|nr:MULTISPECIES: TIGR04219 family outer membrane beta-barrel protein [Acinetobacter]MDI1225075.1 TIGR04219 family outer membrane beta-barrel protein [Acinetobacter sp.]
MKSIQLPLFIATLGLSSFAQADFIGLKGDISYWSIGGDSQIHHKTSSLSNKTGTDNLLLDPYTGLNAKHDLDTKGTIQASVAFEHPIPIIPNVKLKYTKLDTETESNNEFAKTKIDLDHTDLILYYEILDNIVKADVGVGATKLNGTVKQFSQNVDVDEYAPILYAEAGAKLPFTGLSAKAEATYTNVNDVKITDAQAEIQYDFVKSIVLDLGAKVGYRVLNIELSDLDNRDMKFNFKGPYIGLNAHF